MGEGMFRFARPVVYGLWLCAALCATACEDRPPEAPDPLETLIAEAEATQAAIEAAEAEANAHACPLERVTVTEAGAHGVRAVLYFGGSSGDACLDGDNLRGNELVLRIPDLYAMPSVPREIPIGAGGLLSIRHEPDTIRFRLADQAHAEVFHFNGPSRILVDVSTDIPDDDEMIVVLDPGHGGTESGAAIGTRVTEANLVLDITRRAADHLRRRLPEVRVVLTREVDESVTLDARPARANALGADLFVSVHLNAVADAEEVGGVTTFVLDANDDTQEARLAASENGTPVQEVTGIQRLLAGLHRREQIDASRRLARHVHRGTLDGARTVLPRIPDRGVRSALFYVLVGARMPAILLEASFMTKPEEAEALQTETYRERLAQGIARGIEDYLRDPETTHPEPATP